MLRQKLRLAAPYVELWLVQKENVLVEADGLTPEAAFVRIWQWLMLEAALEGGQVVITPDLVEKLLPRKWDKLPPRKSPAPDRGVFQIFFRRSGTPPSALTAISRLQRAVNPNTF